MQIRTRKPLDKLLQLFEPWNEVRRENDSPYSTILARLQALEPSLLRHRGERLEAALREMGVTFGGREDLPLSERFWSCDLLPHLFAETEWNRIQAGFTQRLRAFEAFLHDIYLGEQTILRERRIPVQPVLGSPFFHKSCRGLPPASGRYLHFSSLCLTRLPDGVLAVKRQYFSRAGGLAYLLQNRRVMARIMPELFYDHAVEPVAEAPLDLLEMLQRTAPSEEGFVVMLTAGKASPVYSGHTFLARRMGIPVVQGNDLVVLHDRVYLKTIDGLKPVAVIFNRIHEGDLDPLAFQPDSRLGVPGLVHCLRQKTVSVVNGPGVQLADDPALLAFSNIIIRHYLGEAPRLPTLPTFWCGDADQREEVLDRLEEMRISPLSGAPLAGWSGRLPYNAADLTRIRKLLTRQPSLYVAQPLQEGELTLSVVNGRFEHRLQDHLIYALAHEDEVEVLPGALTRLSGPHSAATDHETGSGSKDTWVLSSETEPSPKSHLHRWHRDGSPLTRVVTSRVAEAFYWMGRYLERTYTMAYMVQTVETLETEELNRAERQLYRPVWNAILPPIEGTGRATQRNLNSTVGRYRLLHHPDDSGSIAFCVDMAMTNARSIQDNLSPEAWAVIYELHEGFRRTRYRDRAEPHVLARATRRLSDLAVRLVPQFFGMAETTILEDDGWRFCELGKWIERAGASANASVSISRPLTEQLNRPPGLDHATEIELSAFLRLLGTRDAYRRVFQSRAEPERVLEILWQHPCAPRSVTRCLNACRRLLEEFDLAHISSLERTLREVEALNHRLARINWRHHSVQSLPGRKIGAPRHEGLKGVLEDLMEACWRLHHIITDSFLTHQALIPRPSQLAFEPLRHEV